MEVELKARKIGGSIGIIIPLELTRNERIFENDLLKVRIRKTSDLSFMFGKGKSIKKSTEQIMKEIDEGEEDRKSVV